MSKMILAAAMVFVSGSISLAEEPVKHYVESITVTAKCHHREIVNTFEPGTPTSAGARKSRQHGFTLAHPVRVRYCHPHLSVDLYMSNQMPA
jgi:hypothetical protein